MNKCVGVGVGVGVCLFACGALRVVQCLRAFCTSVMYGSSSVHEGREYTTGSFWGRGVRQVCLHLLEAVKRTKSFDYTPLPPPPPAAQHVYKRARMIIMVQ